ncbi:CPCC family cysteine-rich protein [Streptomyces sp. NPDC056661]|uniref:CPCC family cysteine-rich protein n=1 Tax=Streptomyces sp. NPDC056661 TaxID=3345898 RepID=UPI0036C7C1FD
MQLALTRPRTIRQVDVKSLAAAHRAQLTVLSDAWWGEPAEDAEASFETIARNYVENSADHAWLTWWEVLALDHDSVPVFDLWTEAPHVPDLGTVFFAGTAVRAGVSMNPRLRNGFDSDLTDVSSFHVMLADELAAAWNRRSQRPRRNWREAHPAGVKAFPCPCCGHLVMSEIGCWEICPVCRWEDDPVKLRWPAFSPGAYSPSLIEAQRNYREFGACIEDARASVRPALPHEQVDPCWRPIDLNSDRFESFYDLDPAPWPQDYTVLYWWLPAFWRRGDLE